MSKQYGVGTYTAKIIGPGIVLITAKGFTPSSNMKPLLEQLAWRIFPPHFALYFESTGDVGGAVMTPFVTSLVALYPTHHKDGKVVNVIDASGLNKVPVEEVSIEDVKSARMTDNVAPGFAVYQQVSVPTNCVIGPFGAIMPAIFFNATAHLGPLDYAAAEAWQTANCGNALI